MRPQHSLRIVFAFLLAIAAAACDSPTDGKSRELPVLGAGAPVSGNVAPAAADSFALALPGGEFRVLLRATSGSLADSLVVSVISESGAVITTALSVGTDTDITAQATAWLNPQADARWKVEVRGQGPNDGGAYTLQLFQRNAAPERAAAALTPGQAVDGEVLDVPGDVDEFTIDGSAGEEWILFGQSLAQAGAVLRMELVERSSGQVIGTGTAAAPTPALESQSTGRVVLPRAGAYLVRIFAEQKEGVRGAYRIRLDRVNRAPETRTAPAVLGDVLAETIGSVGDVDEFTFTAVAGQEMNVLVQLQQGMSSGLHVQVLRLGQLVREMEATAPAASLDVEGTGRFTLESAGPYTVRVFGQPQGTAATATGAYRLELYPVDRRAEAGGQLRLDGAPVAGAIDRPGDVDEYEFPGTAGQLVVIAATHPAGSGALQAVLMGPVNSLTTAELSPDQTSGYSFRVILPVNGTYKMRVWAPASDPMAFGPFTVEAYTVSPAPEHVSATLAIGQTVTAERIDRPGDLDVFTFAGQAGRTVNLFAGVPANAPGIPVAVRAEPHPHTFIFTYGGPMSMDGPSTGRIALENVNYVVTVDPQQLGSDSQRYQGPYGLRLFGIDRRPESGSAAYVLGDTVSGEPIYPAGDIDEYRFQLSETTALRAFWDAPFTGPIDPVAAVLYDEDTNRPVWHAFSTVNGEYLREFTLPPGRYRLSVLNQNVNAPSEAARFGVARLNYRFAIMRQ
ncbi:hypothetical protein [Longimicrobium sp.]|uniref:hypothetical protein n=1 Tax=Longimicrobium sp. TaxID=2029185 RepID=UPI003B3BA5F0